MIDKIERLIDDNTSEDYWYDVSVFTCQELINSFSDIEWQQLSEKVNSYSDEKKIRIVECLANIGNKNSFSIILKLSNTENHDLFMACIDALRDMDLTDLSCDEKNDLLQKVKCYSNNASDFEKTILRAFCSSIGQGF
ncbi:MAG TPA: hypothetical protein DCX21_06125 [Eubacterium sp.]|nr:hypothetical protein [Eubacterium sp.]HBZ53356.1 hypothetical protein [Eubacterium sp.]